MKKIIFSLAVVLFAMGVQAAHISREKAIETAASFWRNESVAGKLSTAIPTIYTSNDYYYIVNNDNDNGFVILSADDRFPAVLGWSDNGAYNESDVPPSLRWLLNKYQLQMEASMSESHNIASVQFREGWSAVNPFIKTKWNQNSPFNDLCPSINGKKCVTGCVATAMAQVMKYYEWPAKGRGSNFYNWNGGFLSLDFSGITFDWKNMSDTYGSSSTAAQKKAVATLMQACGYSVEMDYGVQESPGNMGLAYRAFNIYFDYNDKYIFREQCNSEEEWETLIYNEIKAKRPVIYSGQSSDGGHAFILDGYSSNGSFHVNWGWGGSYDGYYLIGDMNPLKNTSGYVDNCFIVYGFEKLNRVEVNNLFYNLSDDGLTLVLPPSGGYSGDITVPASVVVNGKTQPVVDIAIGVMFNLDNVTSLNIEAPIWDEIPDERFKAFRINKLTLPESVKRIGKEAFYASNITELKATGVKEIDGAAFQNCRSLTSASFSEELKSIANMAFDDCEKLIEFKFPASLTFIGASAFRRSGLNEVVMPGSVAKIPERAFRDCKNLKTVILEDGVEIIDEDAFYNCEAMQYILLPSSLKFIGNSALSHCYDLTRIDCYAPMPPELMSIQFGWKGVPELHVPLGTKSLYLNAPVWEDFGNENIIADLGDIDYGFDGVEDVKDDGLFLQKDNHDVYTSSGILIFRGATDEQIRMLPSGFYIVGRQKKFIP